MIDGKLSDEEVWEKFPEVELIENNDLQEKTVDAIARITPDYFFDVPATSSEKFHNHWARKRHGLHIHVKQVASAYQRFVRSRVKQQLITDFEADCGRAAVLLHDALKYGTQYDDNDSAAKNHDVLAGQWLRSHTDLPTAVVEAVECHNGPWYEGPAPTTEVARLVHDSDMAASSPNITCGVWKPHDDITNKYPALPRANL